MTVPAPVCAPVRVGATLACSSAGLDSISFARPKSSTFAKPSRETMMFPGLRSRWTIPAPWALAMPSAAWAR